MRMTDIKSIHEMAKKFSISYTTLWGMVRTGKVPDKLFSRIGSHILFDEKPFSNWYTKEYLPAKFKPSKFKYQISIWMDDKLRSRISDFCQTQHITKTSLITEAIDVYLEKFYNGKAK